MRRIVPIRELDRRMPTQGRIRIGAKVKMANGKSRPGKLNNFRFTSADKAAVLEIANLYGGEPEAWVDGPRAGEWQVTTTSNNIHIALPPDPLGDSPVYEHWLAGGCARRCDGEMCEISQRTPEGSDKVDVPCLCTAEGAMVCKPKTRLSVILRSIRFGGVWRLESGGWNVAHEMPGMVDMIQSLQQRGIVRGILTLAERSSVKDGKTSKFAVPALALDQDIEALASGQAHLQALAPAPPEVRGLSAVPHPSTLDVGDGDDVPVDAEVVDAEIIDHPMKEAIETVQSAAPANRQVRMILLCKEVASEHAIDDKQLRQALVATLTAGTETSSNALTPEQRERGIGVLEDLRAGRREWGGVVDGRLRAAVHDDT